MYGLEGSYGHVVVHRAHHKLITFTAWEGLLQTTELSFLIQQRVEARAPWESNWKPKDPWPWLPLKGSLGPGRIRNEVN